MKKRQIIINFFSLSQRGGFCFYAPRFFCKKNMEKNDRKKGKILKKCGNLDIRIAEKKNRRS
ncbi:hypothetical protein, partial [Escherichia coli]|uniref:hypothetical protein n=1 Tax=Escherichia coli TaxID=562 RepID=UPI0024AF5911